MNFTDAEKIYRIHMLALELKEMKKEKPINFTGKN